MSRVLTEYLQTLAAIVGVTTVLFLCLLVPSTAFREYRGLEFRSSSWNDRWRGRLLKASVFAVLIAYTVAMLPAFRDLPHVWQKEYQITVGFVEEVDAQSDSFWLHQNNLKFEYSPRDVEIVRFRSYRLYHLPHTHIVMKAEEIRPGDA